MFIGSGFLEADEVFSPASRLFKALIFLRLAELGYLFASQRY